MNKNLFIILCICMLCGNLVAQDYVRPNDGELWFSAQLNKEITDKVSVSLKEAIRFDGDVSALKVVFTQASAKYRIIKPWSVSVGYRFSTTENYEQRHRLILSSQVKQKIKRFSLSWRLRYEKESETRKPIENRLRNRFKLAYNPKNSDFGYYASFETFYSYDYRYADISRFRYTLGLEYEINKKTDVNLSGIFQHDTNIARPKEDTILRLGLSYDL